MLLVDMIMRESLKKLRSNDKRGLICMVFLTTLIVVVLLTVCFVELFHAEAVKDGADIKRLVFSEENCSASASARKLLQTDDDYGSGDANGTGCSKNDIAIYQGSTAPLPNGVPSYIVQIVNICASDCSISNIHVSCGWFSSVRLVNPSVFRRVGYDDCLVNDGQPLGPGESLSFQYANSFQYPLAVTSVECS